MAEYIEREAAEDAVGEAHLKGLNPLWELRDVPAADVVPVVHGRWEYDLPTINTYGQLRCSICNWWTLDPSVDRSYSYCPNCGAKMGGGTGNA
jgi:hypothetical protein